MRKGIAINFGCLSFGDEVDSVCMASRADRARAGFAFLFISEGLEHERRDLKK